MQQPTEWRARQQGLVYLALLVALLGLPSLAVPQSTLISGHQVIVGSENYCDSAGSGTNAYACTLLETITEYNAGATYRFLANAANTGAATLQLNGIASPRPLVKFVGGVNLPLVANDILAGALVTVTYDGTSMQMQSMLGNTASGGGTGTLQLWPGQITLPDGTASNGFAQAQVARSTGTPPTNGPNLHFTELLFDGAADETVMSCFVLPADYASGGTLYINWKRALGTGAANVVWKAGVAALTPGNNEVPNTKVLAAIATATTAAGTTLQGLVQTTIALTMDSAAARDSVCVAWGRDADNAADTLNAVDTQVLNAWMEYAK